MTGGRSGPGLLLDADRLGSYLMRGPFGPTGYREDMRDLRRARQSPTWGTVREELVPDRRGRVERFLDRHRRHRHRVVRRTWTLDDSSWMSDPNAWEYCECGARRRLWGGVW